MEEDQTAQFISALAHLQPIDADDIASLDGWSIDQLKQEVIRLRRALSSVGGVNPMQGSVAPPPNLGPVPPGVPQGMAVGGVRPTVGPLSNVQPDIDSLGRMGQQPPPDLLPHIPVYGYVHQMPPTAQQTSPHSHVPVEQERKRSFDDTLPPLAGPSTSTSAARKRTSHHDSGTGKRVERGRRVELQRAIRAKMRYMMGIGLEDDLPPPTEGEVGSLGWVPSWTAGVGDARNSEWLDRVVSSFINEATALHHWSKVPPEDLEPEIVKGAARTAFQNFAKRYLADVDPKQAKKQQKYVKNRRRWARKDLKQKRRAKSAQDPSFADIHLPPSALHIDYMSSEYSSAGDDEDDDGLGEQRRFHWAQMLRSRSPEGSSGKGGKGGWAEGVSEKVLEVRTPTWRSSRLDQIYRRLDTISAAQAAMRATPAAQQVASGKAGTGTRLGHVAPSHQRFTLPPELMRRGRGPRDQGEAWMWASGKVGVWPEGAEQADQLGRLADVGSDLARDAAVASAMHATHFRGGSMSVSASGSGSGGGGDIIDPNNVDAMVDGWTDVS